MCLLLIRYVLERDRECHFFFFWTTNFSKKILLSVFKIVLLADKILKKKEDLTIKSHVKKKIWHEKDTHPLHRTSCCKVL